VVAVDLGGNDERVQRFLAAVPGARFEPCDVGDPQACAALVERIEARVAPIDILVNAAGITRDARLVKMQRAQWEDVMRVNLDSVFNLCQLTVEGMMQRGFGRIVNISSVNAQTGQFGQTNYAAAKAGMHGFTMALARETARKGVTVNSVSPGYIDTEMTRAVRDDIRQQIIAAIPIGRVGDPDDIARAVAFLAADDAGYLTGVNLPVNGGMFMSF
jgi:acetoacetyl-CoA reductase